MRVNLFVGKYFFPTEPNPNWLLILYFFLNPLTPCTNIVSLTTKMFHRCFDFYDDHAAVKLLFLYWHPDTGLILYMVVSIYTELDFFFFFKSMYFICDECTCTCSWSLPLDTQRCSCCCRCPLSRGRCWALQLSNCLIFFLLFLFNQLITSAPRTCWEITFLHLLLYLL